MSLSDSPVAALKGYIEVLRNDLMDVRAERNRLKDLVAVLCDHLADQAFPMGRPHGACCECERCAAWTDMQHARVAIDHPKAHDVEHNPYKA